MEVKELSVKRGKEHVLEVLNDEIKYKMIPDCDLTIEEACYDDFTSGYNQALKDSKAPEMLEMLKETTEVIKWYMDNSTSELPEPFFNIGANQIEQIEQLIKQATEL